MAIHSTLSRLHHFLPDWIFPLFKRPPGSVTIYQEVNQIIPLPPNLPPVLIVFRREANRCCYPLVCFAGAATRWIAEAAAFFLFHQLRLVFFCKYVYGVTTIYSRFIRFVLNSHCPHFSDEADFDVVRHCEAVFITVFNDDSTSGERH